MRAYVTAVFLFALVIAVSWIANLVKLTDCDFKADYKCEVLHGVGLVPAVSVITVWFGTDETKKEPAP